MACRRARGPSREVDEGVLTSDDARVRWVNMFVRGRLAIGVDSATEMDVASVPRAEAWVKPLRGGVEVMEEANRGEDGEGGGRVGEGGIRGLKVFALGVLGDALVGDECGIEK